MLEALGMRLRSERLKIGLDQRDFGEVAGVSKNSQSAYEQGKTPPTVEYLLRLEMRGVDIAYVLTGKRLDGSYGPQETILLDNFAQLSSREREAVVQLTTILAGNVIQPADLPQRRKDLPTLHAPATAYRSEGE